MSDKCVLQKIFCDCMSYPTVKVAKIEDPVLGSFRCLLMAAIFFYVVGYQIMWRGNHLEMHDLIGVYQLQIDPPTRNSCNAINVECMQNFSSLSGLRYCSQSPIPGPVKLPCEYWDAHQLGQLTDQGLMLPTHISTFRQTSGCEPSAANNWTCGGFLFDFLDKKGHVQKKRGQATPESDVFVADIERFTLTLDHSVRSALGQRYYANEMVGYWLDCNHENASDSACTPRPVHCGQESCRDRVASLQQNRAAKESPSKFRGDRRSLALTGLSSRTRVQRTKGSSRSAELEPSEVRSHNTPSAAEGDHSPNQTPVPQAMGPRTVATLQLRHLETDSNAFSTPSPKPVEDTAPGRASDIESLGVVSIPEGDMFSIGMLLRAANVSLDERRHNVPSWVGGTYRSSGFVLVIRVHYSNIESWLGLKVLPWNILGPRMHYTYRITKHASHDDFMLSKVQLLDKHLGEKKEKKKSLRTLTDFYGIRVLIEQSGNVAVWDNIQLLLILTTTLALAAVATYITDFVALNILPQSKEYAKFKFEEQVKDHGIQSEQP